MGELAADHGADLSDFAHAAEAIETGHEGVVQGRRDRERRQQAGELEMVARGDEQTRLQHHLGQLLDEQRHAVGARDDLLEDLGRQSPGAGDPRDHGQDLAPAQPGERQRGDVAPSPGRRETGSKGDEQQDRQPLDALDREIQKLAGARVDPLGVLEDDQERLPAAPGPRAARPAPPACAASGAAG